MTEEKFSKKVSWTCGYCIVLGIIMLLAFIVSFTSEGISFSTIEALVCCILFFLCYFFTNKRRIEGSIIGIVIGILYVISFLRTYTIFSIILGILIIWDSYTMVKYMKDINKNKEEKDIDKEN